MYGALAAVAVRRLNPSNESQDLVHKVLEPCPPTLKCDHGSEIDFRGGGEGFSRLFAAAPADTKGRRRHDATMGVKDCSLSPKGAKVEASPDPP